MDTVKYLNNHVLFLVSFMLKYWPSSNKIQQILFCKISSSTTCFECALKYFFYTLLLCDDDGRDGDVRSIEKILQMDCPSS